MKDLQRTVKAKVLADKPGGDVPDFVSEGYAFPPLDDILTEEDSRKLILRRQIGKPVVPTSSRSASDGACDGTWVYKTYVLEVKIAHKKGSEPDLDLDLFAARLKDMGIDVASVRARPTVSAEFSNGPVRVHQPGAPRKWEDDVLADASRSLSTLLTDEQRRQRRRAQVAAASRRLRERRKGGGSGGSSV
ncbi:MAG: hypothetical protein ABL901_02425 [Hyphomicrobiaceae bacterium]